MLEIVRGPAWVKCQSNARITSLDTNHRLPNASVSSAFRLSCHWNTYFCKVRCIRVCHVKKREVPFTTLWRQGRQKTIPWLFFSRSRSYPDLYLNSGISTWPALVELSILKMASILWPAFRRHPSCVVGKLILTFLKHTCVPPDEFGSVSKSYWQKLNDVCRLVPYRSKFWQ